ncbi:MAG TPA: glycosyltransferase family A protein [Burkholderiales bacterium]|nr:glycosyltransferase family A protein [Burkholderiales bacterium]
MSNSYSVVIPAFNAERTIGEAIESVLNQTVGPQAVIVVDDGSTDATAQCARALGERVTVIRQSNTGCGAATTRGLDAVATPFVACLDADDLWVREKIALQMERLAAVPELAGVFSLARLFKHGEQPHSNAPVQEFWGRTTMLMRTASARRVGPVIDPAHSRGDMIDWIARARELGLRLEMMQMVLALRRIIPGSLSHGRDSRDYGYLQTVKAALDRKRRGMT